MLVAAPTARSPLIQLRLDRGALALVSFVLVVVAYLMFSPRLFNDGDTSWHLAAGRLMLDTWSVPATDPFSYTFAGRAWTAHEWLTEAAMAGAYRMASWGGLAALTAGAVGLTLMLLGIELRRWLPPQRLIAALTLIAAMLAPFMLARPHVLAWPLLAGWTILLLRARAEHRAPPLWAAGVMVAWANAHASFIIGLALIGVFALEALIDEPDRRRTLTRWAAFGAASLAASLLTPHGLQGLLYPFQVSGMAALPLIVEWRPTTLAEDWLFLAVVAGTLVLLAIRRPRVPPLRLLLLAGTLVLAMAHVRHQPLVAILAALILVEPLSRTTPTPPPEGGWFPVPLAAMVALGLLALTVLRLNVTLPRQDSASNPVTAIDRLPPALRACPVLNSYGFGGPLILTGIRPYIDGRGDMYGDAFMIVHQRIMDGDAAALDRAVRRWGIGWTILEPGTPLIARLDASPLWRRAYANGWAVVHVRR